MLNRKLVVGQARYRAASFRGGSAVQGGEKASKSNLVSVRRWTDVPRSADAVPMSSFSCIALKSRLRSWLRSRWMIWWYSQTVHSAF